MLLICPTWPARDAPRWAAERVPRIYVTASCLVNEGVRAVVALLAAAVVMVVVLLAVVASGARRKTGDAATPV